MLITKKKLLLQLLELDKSIRYLITEENIDELSQKIEQRQDIIERLKELGKKSDVSEQLDSNVINDIDLLISEVKKSDTESKLLADSMLEKYREQIRSLNESKKKMGSYTQAETYSDGFFVDAKK